jgi:hypothetical protein
MFNIERCSAETGVQTAWAKFEGSEFEIAYAGNAKFLRTFNRLQHPYRKKIEKGTLDPLIQRDILCQAIADTILVNWKKVNNNKGPIDHTPEVAKMALLNNPDLRDFVQEFAMELDNYRKEEIDEVGESLSDASIG